MLLDVTAPRAADQLQPAAAPAIRQLDYAQLRDFLGWIYVPENVPQVWMAGFRDMGAKSWHGAAGLDRLKARVPDPRAADLYWCIGLLRAGTPTRSVAAVVAQPLLIVDDIAADTGSGIGSKVDRAKWDALFAAGFPRPSFRVRTSPGNETWGWVLEGDSTTPERWAELALIRAWLAERKLTDDVMDATRYIRLPSGWNSKPERRAEGAAVEASPAVGLVIEGEGEPWPWERAERVDLDAIGRALLGREDWRNAEPPVRAMTGRQLDAAVRAGTVSCTADMNNPEPLIQLAIELGMNPVQRSGGKVEALCPNIGAHSTQVDTGFAFLGDGACKCHHASCRDALRSPDFKAMMMAEYDNRMDERTRRGEALTGKLMFARDFLANAAFKQLTAAAGDDPSDVVEAVAERVTVAAARRELSEEEARAALAARFVWVNPVLCFFDTETRAMLSRDQFDTHPAILAQIKPGASGASRACNVILARKDLRHAEGLTYLPGVQGAVVEAPAGGGRRGRFVNTWVAPDVGRRSGAPAEWLELVARVVPDAAYRNWLLDWLAHMVQQPGKRSPVIPLIVGGQGIGKDMMLGPFVKVLGGDNCQTVSMQKLSSPFNEWQKAVLVILPELKLSGDGRLYNDLKDWTGSETALTINEKHKQPYQITPVANFIGFTNHMDAARGMEADDRRMGVYISPAVKADASYYTAKAVVLKDPGEVERVHEFLATRDLSRFSPHALAPDVNGAKGEMLAANLSRAGAWVYAECQPGGKLHGRRYLTLGEVENMARMSGTPGVANDIGPRVVLAAIQAAKCEPLGRVRIGQGRSSLWIGPGADAAERARIRGLSGAQQGAEADAELSTLAAGSLDKMAS